MCNSIATEPLTVAVVVSHLYKIKVAGGVALSLVVP
jgi:hypothetical protein